MKKGMPAKSGKTTEVLQKVVELLSENKSVLYVSNEYTYHNIYERIKDSVNQDMLNSFYFSDGDRLEALISGIKNYDYMIGNLKDASIVVDIGKDVSDLKCDQDLYVYYQIPRENNSR